MAVPGREDARKDSTHKIPQPAHGATRLGSSVDSIPRCTVRRGFPRASVDRNSGVEQSGPALPACVPAMARSLLRRSFAGCFRRARGAAGSEVRSGEGFQAPPRRRGARFLVARNVHHRRHLDRQCGISHPGNAWLPLASQRVDLACQVPALRRMASGADGRHLGRPDDLCRRHHLQHAHGQGLQPDLCPVSAGLARAHRALPEPARRQARSGFDRTRLLPEASREGGWQLRRVDRLPRLGLCLSPTRHQYGRGASANPGDATGCVTASDHRHIPGAGRAQYPAGLLCDVPDSCATSTRCRTG